jgi:HK97 family phage major capsid protein
MDPKILKLYQDAHELVSKAMTLLDSGGDLTEAQQTQIDGWLKQAADLEKRAKQLETVLELEAKTAKAAKATIQVVKDAGDQPFESDGEFFLAVKNAALHPSREDPRLASRKATGLSEGVPEDGGYLLRSQTKDGILERMYKTGELLSRISADPIGENSNGMTYNAVNETSRANGSRNGGILGYWLGEGGNIPSTKPKFRQLELKLKKVAALCYATDEQLRDTRNLQSWLTRTVPNELRFMAEDAVFEGDGVGKPLGIMQSPCLITVQRETANAISVVDVTGMWARRWAGVNDYVWLIHQDAGMQLPRMTISNTPVYLPAGGLSGAQYGTLFGKPVIETEYNASLNTTGDIMLASLSQYQAINKDDIQEASSIHVQFLTAETAFRFIYRIDGEPLWNSALTPFHGTNTVSPFVVLGSASA